MLNRNSIFALAAISAFAVAAVVPTSASAMRGGFGGGGHAFGGGGFGHTAGLGAFGHGRIGGSFHSYGHNFGGRTFDRSTSRNNSVAGCVGHYCGPGTTPNPGPTPCVTNCGNPGIPPGTPPCSINCGGHLPPPIVWWHRHHLHWGVVENVAPVAVNAVVGVDTVVASGPCNCLTKQYLDDGSVLFKDICTKEAAMATPEELKAQAQGIAPQAQAN